MTTTVTHNSSSVNEQGSHARITDGLLASPHCRSAKPRPHHLAPGAHTERATPFNHRHQSWSNQIKAWIGAYFEEAKWASKGYMPTLEEYLHISVMTSCYPIFTSISLVIREEVTEDVLDLLLCVPKIVEASALIGRVMNDIVSTKFEHERNHVASSVQCYMNDHGATKQEACLKLGKIVADAWKVLNEECLKSCSAQKHLNMIAMNYARMSEVVYKHEDSYTNPSGKMKENISMLLVQSMQD